MSIASVSQLKTADNVGCADIPYRASPYCDVGPIPPPLPSYFVLVLVKGFAILVELHFICLCLINQAPTGWLWTTIHGQPTVGFSFVGTCFFSFGGIF